MKQVKSSNASQLNKAALCSYQYSDTSLSTVTREKQGKPHKVDRYLHSRFLHDLTACLIHRQVLVQHPLAAFLCKAGSHDDFPNPTYAARHPWPECIHQEGPIQYCIRLASVIGQGLLLHRHTPHCRFSADRIWAVYTGPLMTPNTIDLSLLCSSFPSWLSMCA